jgi:hypothetical protein
MTVTTTTPLSNATATTTTATSVGAVEPATPTEQPIATEQPTVTTTAPTVATTTSEPIRSEPLLPSNTTSTTTTITITLPGVILTQLSEEEQTDLEVDIIAAVSQATQNVTDVDSVVLEQQDANVTATLVLALGFAQNDTLVDLAKAQLDTQIEEGTFKVSVKGSDVTVRAASVKVTGVKVFVDLNQPPAKKNALQVVTTTAAAATTVDDASVASTKKTTGGGTAVVAVVLVVLLLAALICGYAWHRRGKDQHDQNHAQHAALDGGGLVARVDNQMYMWQQGHPPPAAVAAAPAAAAAEAPPAAAEAPPAAAEAPPAATALQTEQPPVQLGAEPEYLEPVVRPTGAGAVAGADSTYCSTFTDAGAASGTATPTDADNTHYSTFSDAGAADITVRQGAVLDTNPYAYSTVMEVVGVGGKQASMTAGGGLNTCGADAYANVHGSGTNESADDFC